MLTHPGHARRLDTLVGGVQNGVDLMQSAQIRVEEISCPAKQI